MKKMFFLLLCIYLPTASYALGLPLLFEISSVEDEFTFSNPIYDNIYGGRTVNLGYYQPRSIPQYSFNEQSTYSYSPPNAGTSGIVAQGNNYHPYNSAPIHDPLNYLWMFYSNVTSGYVISLDSDDMDYNLAVTHGVISVNDSQFNESSFSSSFPNANQSDYLTMLDANSTTFFLTRCDAPSYYFSSELLDGSLSLEGLKVTPLTMIPEPLTIVLLLISTGTFFFVKKETVNKNNLTL